MALPTNFLKDVQSYTLSDIAYLRNTYGIIDNANKKYQQIQNIPGQLGASATYSLQSYFVGVDDLAITSFESTTQRYRTLTVDQKASIPYAFSDQERLFNFNNESYMREIGRAAMNTLGSKMEQNVAQNFVANTYMFYGDGVTDINSYTQLANAIASIVDRGGPASNMKGYIPVIKEPAIIGSGLSQFVPDRNDKDAFSWEVADWNQTKWIKSNLLPTHFAGTVGNDVDTLTVTSVTTDADGGISAITFSGVTDGAVVDPDAIKQYDLLQFQDGVTGYTNLRFRRFVGYSICNSPVQFQATADAASDGAGNVTVSIYPKLYSAAGVNQNINTPIVAGMQVKALPDHLVGGLVTGDALLMSMPKLPTQDPYPSVSEVDPISALALRLTYGSILGENTTGFIHSSLWGSDLDPDHAIRLVFKL